LNDTAMLLPSQLNLGLIIALWIVKITFERYLQGGKHKSHYKLKYL